MKVLAIHRYYWPDTPPYAYMLRAIVMQWVSDGHEVSVLASQPSYKTGIINKRQAEKELLDGVQVIRMSLPPEAGRPLTRIFNALRLGLRIFWQGFIRERYDVIMVSTSPPVLAGWFTAVVAKLSGARLIYHCMDIHPEIGRISGEFSHPKVFSALSRLDQWTCSQARPVVVLSDDMAQTLISRNPESPPETLVVNNFSLPTDEAPLSELPFSWPDSQFVLVFAGNIGRFQGLDYLIEAMIRLLDRTDIHLLMLGEGAERDRLAEKSKAAGANVSFVGHQSVSVAKATMTKASAGFVSLIPELYRYAYPSKTMTYLEQGCPVLVAAEVESCLACDVVNSGSGLAVPVGDIEALANAIMRLADKPDQTNLMRQNAIEFSRRAFATDVILPMWSSLMNRSDI